MAAGRAFPAELTAQGRPKVHGHRVDGPRRHLPSPAARRRAGCVVRCRSGQTDRLGGSSRRQGPVQRFPQNRARCPSMGRRKPVKPVALVQRVRARQHPGKAGGGRPVLRGGFDDSSPVGHQGGAFAGEVGDPPEAAPAFQVVSAEGQLRFPDAIHEKHVPRCVRHAGCSWESP